MVRYTAAMEQRGLRREALAIILLGAIAGGGLLTAGCGLKKRNRCTATASYAGKDRVGHGDNFEAEAPAKDAARADLCAEYCRSEDPDVEAAYQKVKGAKDTRVERLNAVHNEPVLPVLNACKSRCDAAMATTPIAYRCENSGL